MLLLPLNVISVGNFRDFEEILLVFWGLRATEKITCKNRQMLCPAFTRSVTRRGAGWEHGFYR
jgi:hypothetical protein